MEKSGFDAGVARVLMVATKELIVQRSRGARGLLLHKEDTENVSSFPTEGRMEGRVVALGGLTCKRIRC
jgi:hypothetical protein